MKKLFTFICALVALTASAATIDDVLVCKHSYVLVMDEWNNNGTQRPGKGQLFGDGFFLDVTGGSVATNKGKSNPAEKLVDTDEYRYGEPFATKYSDVGEHLNSLRIKNAQDVIAMKVTAGSKLIFLMQGNNTTGTKARIPKIATDAKLENALNAAPTDDNEAVSAGYKYEWTSDDDRTIYIGSYNGDAFIGILIVEANEAPGTPSVKVGDQTFDNGLYYREVTCKANTYELFGIQLPTVVTYTTDGTMPTAASPIYTEPLKCYQNMTVKFQAFVDYGDGQPGDICEGADNEGIVNFLFNAPTISADGANVTITSEYEGAKNYYSYGDIAATEGSEFTLTESASVTAYSEIVNGSYTTFTTMSTSKDVYVLDPITEQTTVSVTAGTVVRDAEESAVQGKDIYVVEGGAISADSKHFYVKNLEFAAVASADETVAQYQVPDGQEVYIKMNATNITFKVDEPSMVVVTCSKNACKNIDSESANDRQCKVTVDGVTYGNEDILEEGANVITFDVEAGIHTFTKFSGTGNILISSIEINPGVTAVAGVAEAEVAAPAKAVKVAKNGNIVIVNGDAEYSVAGTQVK